MSRPVTIVTGVHPDAMAAASLSLMLDLPNAVVVRHRIDLERSVLVRVVSDITGVVEHEEIDLEHACVPCAIREDVVPTLTRVARDPRWASVLAHLPVGAEPDQVCHVLTRDPALRRALRVERVVTAVDGAALQDDLLGDALLADRGLESSHGDRRGIGEVLADLLEYADLVVATDPVADVDVALVHALARPGVPLVRGAEHAASGCTQQHAPALTRAWIDPLRAAPLPPLEGAGIWRVDLRSQRAFHPARLLDGLGQLGSGRHRSRGVFWLPSRPDRAIVWAGAGGQVSVGNGPAWGAGPRQSRLVITGVGTAPDHLPAAFGAMLLEPGEDVALPGFDGFEPWLGPIQDVA